LVKGPSLADRVVALDLVAVISAGIVVTYAVESGHAIYLDATLVIASVSFLSTVAFGFFIEREGMK
jgi:multicomponent Na+:H+ antiporter subunit F